MTPDAKPPSVDEFLDRVRSASRAAPVVVKGRHRHGSLFWFFHQHYDKIAKALEKDPTVSLEGIAAAAGDFTDAKGKAPTPRTVKRTWERVAAHKRIARGNVQKPKPEPQQEAPAAPKPEPRPQPARNEPKPIPEWLSQPVAEEEYDFPVLTLPKGVPWQPKKADTPTEGDQQGRQTQEKLLDRRES
jgi:hypothetical protein